jgi:hypothetical protein
MPEGNSAGLRRPGDGNGDGVLDISDAVHLLRFLFAGGVPLPCEGASASEGPNLRILDGNGDGKADVSDAVHLLDFLFADGAPHVLGTSCAPVEGCTTKCGS